MASVRPISHLDKIPTNQYWKYVVLHIPSVNLHWLICLYILLISERRHEERERQRAANLGSERPVNWLTSTCLQLNLIASKSPHAPRGVDYHSYGLPRVCDKYVLQVFILTHKCSTHTELLRTSQRWLAMHYQSNLLPPQKFWIKYRNKINKSKATKKEKCIIISFQLNI